MHFAKTLCTAERARTIQNLRHVKTRTWEGPQCPCWRWQFWMIKFVMWCLLGRTTGCFVWNEIGAFSRRLPTLSIPSATKVFKLCIGLDHGTHFFLSPGVFRLNRASYTGNASCWTALTITLSALITLLTVKGPLGMLSGSLLRRPPKYSLKRTNQAMAFPKLSQDE